jgi:hypothetical protein
LQLDINVPELETPVGENPQTDISELQFSEIDDSIFTLRQTLTELKHYFPNPDKIEGQNAA